MWLFRLGSVLKEIEKQHRISVRWTPQDKQYLEVENQFAETKREQLLLGLWKAAKRRKFLLQLKAKYAGLSLHDLVLFAGRVYCVVPKRTPSSYVSSCLNYWRFSKGVE